MLHTQKCLMADTALIAIWREKISFCQHPQFLAPNTQANALDFNYAPRKDILLGSRYVIANDMQNTFSYTGVYSTFQIDEIAKGLNFGISYDKTGIDKQNNQFNINLKSKF